MPGPRSTSGRSRETLTALAALGEFLGTVTGTSGLVLAVVLPLLRWQPISAGHVHVLLTVAMATIGAAAAILGTVASRLVGDRRLAWLAAAVATYCLVVLPLTVLGPGTVPVDAETGMAWLAGQVVVVGLLVVALRTPVLLGAGPAWATVVVAALAAQATGELAEYLTGPEQTVIIPVVLTAAVLAGWVVVGCALLLAGYQQRHPALMGVAVGLTTLACLHLYWTGSRPAGTGVDLLFDQLRLFALIVVFAGMLGLARRAMVLVGSERLAHEEEMRLAAVHLQRAADRAAERDHELRNGLAGLSGITGLLSSSASGAEREGLRSAMLAELARLAAMIDGVAPAGGSGYDVTAELERLVRLRRAAGMAITLEPAAGLAAAGTPAVLAQVLTNLLANCARHAPGSAVRVAAGRRGRRIVITVEDDGPGVPAGRELAVLDRGERDPRGGGDGLGLYLSRRLLAGEGAELRVLPAGSTGCVVEVDLPTATDAPVAAAPSPRRGFEQLAAE